MDPLEYCREKSAPPGSPGYYAVLFQPPARAGALLALMGLERELRDVVEACSEPAVAAHKLAFWHDELAALGDGRARHPVTRALATWAPRALHADDARRLLDGVARRLACSQVRDSAELDRSIAATAGRMGEAMARACDAGDERASRALHAAACAGERVRLLSLPRRAGMPPHTGVPLDAMARAGATPAQVDSGGSAQAVARLRHDLMGQAQSAIERARAALDAPRGLAATRLRLASAVLVAMRRGGYGDTGAARAALPVVLLWHAWRGRPPS